MCTVAATWSRWTGRRTTPGKAVHLTPFVLVVSGIALLSGGCAGPPIEPMHRYVDTSQRNMEMALRQARTETNGLRAELADARIAAAKQEADLVELRRQVAELHQIAEARQAEQALASAERDKINQVKNDLQTQLVEVPLLRQNLADAKAAEAKAQAQIKELQSALVMAGGDLKKVAKGGMVPAKAGQLKKRTKPVTTAAAGESGTEPHDTVQASAQASAAPVLMAQAGVLTAAASGSDESGPKRITVAKDETLWRISRRFGLTVDQVQEANGLRGTLIREGQVLVIPSR